MVNVIIYLKNDQHPKELVELLLREKLISSASIDNNNVSYKYEQDAMSECVYNVITAQTKSLLFNEIIEWVEKKYGSGIPVVSVPIINSNNSFAELVKSSTKLI